MAIADQRMRQSGAMDRSVDEKNTEELKEIIKNHGWPTVEKVGGYASNAAWLIAQHADHDPEFQAECLVLMKAEYEKDRKSVNPKNIAYLEDRVRVNTGRPQLYGTQFFADENGVFQARPIEDPENLDERRRGAGLSSFADYEKNMREMNKKYRK